MNRYAIALYALAAVLSVMLATAVSPAFLYGLAPAAMIAGLSLRGKQEKQGTALSQSPEKTIYDCVLYDSVTLESRMVEGGVIDVSEMTLCEDAECPLCKQFRERRLEAARSARKKEVEDQAVRLDDKKFDPMSAEEKSAVMESYREFADSKYGYDISSVYTLESEEPVATFKNGYIRQPKVSRCSGCSDATWYPACPRCTVAQYRKALKARKDAEELLRAEERAKVKELEKKDSDNFVTVAGHQVRRPVFVPKGANDMVRMTPGSDFMEVIWTWYDVSTGKEKYCRAPLPSLNDYYSWEDE